MSIQSNLAAPGIIRKREFSFSGAVIHLPRIPLLVKIVMATLVCLMLLILCILAVSRTGAIPEIPSLPELYLPGNVLPQLAKDATCVEEKYLYRSCVVDVAGQRIYLTYYASSRMIVRMAIPVREHNIGELIIAWGSPSGITQIGDSVFAYWGKRSAILYTNSFRPENLVKFIQYDFDPQPASAWRGFKPFEKSS